MATTRFITKASLTAVLVLATTSLARAQADAFDEDLKSQPFVYGSVGAFPSGAGGTTTYGFGGGMDFLAYRGLGVGADFVIFGNQSFGFGVATANGSYHFVPRTSRLVPFVKAGVGAGGEGGNGGVSFGSFGGGVNVWNLNGAAIRIEVVDRFPLSGGDHHFSLQVGVTF